MLSFLIIGNAQGRLRYSWVWDNTLQLLPSPEFAVWARRVLHKVASSSIPLSTEGINSTDSSKKVFPFDSFESFTLAHGKLGQNLSAIVGCDTVTKRVGWVHVNPRVSKTKK